MDYKELGRNIRKYRRIADLTQEQLAEECDCSTSYIGQIENARSKPSVEALVNIANALGVSEAALFHWQDRKKRLRDDKIEKLFEGILALGDDKIADVSWLASGWGGDLRALVEFDILYASMSEEDRRDVASLGIRLYDVCRKEGRLEGDAPAADFPYLEQALRDLWVRKEK